MRKPEALLVILFCFLGSGLIRVWESGAAIAEEVGSLAATEQPAPKAMTAQVCPPQLEPESLLLAIREREAQLDARESRLGDREQVLRISRLKIDEQLAALEDAEKKLTATMAIADEAAEKDIVRLTTVYENMKPKDAAALFEAMEPAFAAGFLGRMRPDAAAGIMAGLNPQAAYTISVILAGRNANAPKS